jgi:hypothetical protein
MDSVMQLKAPTDLTIGKIYLLGRLPVTSEAQFACAVSGNVYTEGKLTDQSDGPTGKIEVMFPDGKSGNYMIFDLHDVDIKEVPAEWHLHPNYEVDRIASEKAMVIAMIEDNTVIIEDSDDEVIPDSEEEGDGM